MKKLIWLFLIASAFAQTHTYPALDTSNTYTGTNQFNANLITKTTPAIDIRSYGNSHTCVDAANDATAFQAAINAAQSITGGNANATLIGPPGGTCTIATDITVSGNGISNISIGGVAGPSTSAGAGWKIVLTAGAQIKINPSVTGNGQGVRLHHFTILCNSTTSSTDICPSLIKIGDSAQVGSTFGPIYIDHMTLNGHHDATSGAGSYGAVNGITCASHCALQVKITDNNIENFSGALIDLANSTNSGGTNIVIRDNQLFDAPYGVKVSSSGPVEIADNYYELITHGVEINNAVSWTLGQYHIYGNEFNLETIPPYNNQTNTGDQRCLYITNQGGPTATMTAWIDFHNNKCNESAGYVFGAQGLAPYGVETNLACGAFCYSVMLDSHDNYYAGMTTSAILANIGFGWATSHNDLVTATLAAYQAASNLDSIRGTFVGGAYYEPNGVTISKYLAAINTSFAPIFQACTETSNSNSCADSSAYFQITKGTATNFGGWTAYDNAGTALAACGFGGDLVSGAILNQACANGYQQQFGNVKSIGLRNTINSTDHQLALNASDQLTLDGVAIAGTLPSQGGHAGEYLGTNGTSATWSTPPGGGNVTGPGSSTTNHVSIFGDASGTLLADSGITYTNLPTMASNAAGSGNIITSAGANKTQQDSGTALTSLAPKASPVFTGTVDAHSAGAFDLPGSLSTGFVKVTTSTGAVGSTTGSRGDLPVFGASGAPSSFTNVVYAAVGYGSAAGIIADDTTDQTAAFQALLDAMSGANHRLDLILPATGFVKISSDVLTWPGNVNLVGCGPQGMQDAAAKSAACGLDLQYAANYIAKGCKINILEKSEITVRDVAFVDSGTDTACTFLITNSIPHFYRNSYRGSTNRNDIFILGGTSCTGGLTDCFNGYSGEIYGGFGQYVKRFAVYQTSASAVGMHDITCDYTCQNPAGGFIEIVGGSSAALANTFSNIVPEMGARPSDPPEKFYDSVIAMTSGQGMVMLGVHTADPKTGGGSSAVTFGSGISKNLLICGYLGSSSTCYKKDAGDSLYNNIIIDPNTGIFSANTIYTANLGDTTTGITKMVMPTTGTIQWGSGGPFLSRAASGVVGASTNNANNLNAIYAGAAFRGGGTAATLAGTGACSTRSGQVGGSSIGQVQCTAVGGTPATLTITPGSTAPNGWFCAVQDTTTQSVGSVTTRSTTAPVVTLTNVIQNDILIFNCSQY